MQKPINYTIFINICILLIFTLFFLKIYNPIIIHISIFGLVCFLAYKKERLNKNTDIKKYLLTKGVGIIILLTFYLFYRFMM